MAFASIEQLRSKTWPSHAAAVKELKRNGFAERGDDYAVREASPGSWQVASLDGEAAPVAPAKKQPARPAAQEPPVVPAKRSALARVRAAPMKKESAKAKTPAAAKDLKSNVVTTLFPPAEPRKAPEPEEPPAPPEGADLNPLPLKGEGYYAARIDAVHLRQNSVVLHVLDLARKLRLPISITDPSGETVRRIDPAAVAAKPGARRMQNAGGGAPRTTGKTAECVALLYRKEGATYAELVALTEWSFGERYIIRMAAREKAKMEKLGDKHWRLVKP